MILLRNIIVFSLLICAFGSKKKDKVLRIAKEEHPHRRTTSWDCNREWPQLDIFLPVPFREGGRLHEWKEIFLTSFLLFWPIEVSKSKLLIVADEEVRNSTAIRHAEKLLSSLDIIKNHFEIVFNSPSIYYGDTGHNRQQFIMFYPENFTKSEYIGFADTDCYFINYVDREDIFENGKPVVNGKIGNPHKRYNRDILWHAITETTYEVMGLYEPMKCMAYFPVVVKAEHLIKLRKFMEEKYNDHFYNIYRKYIVTRLYSQFNLMCAYLFAFHRDDYVWYVHDLSPEWDYKDPPPIVGQMPNRTQYTESMYYPKPRIATHVRYHAPSIDLGANFHNYMEIMVQGVCMSPPFPKSQLFNYVDEKSSNNFVDTVLRLTDRKPKPKDPDTKTLKYDPCGFYSQERQYQTEVFDNMHQFEWGNYLPIVPRWKLQNAEFERFQRFRHCNYSFNNMNIKPVINFFSELVEDGEVILTDETQKVLFYAINDSLRDFPNWDTFVSWNGPSLPKKKLNHVVYASIPKGPTMTPKP